jgi:hypothetical protein
MQISPIEPAARENLIRLVEAWCAATGNKLITAGRYAHSDPRFFVDLIARHKKWIKQGKPLRIDADRKGSFTARLYDKMVTWFYDLSHWPEGTTYDSFPELNDLSQKPQPNEDHDGTTEVNGTQETPQGARPEQGEARGGASAALARLRR